VLHNNSKDEVKRLHAALREQRLEEEKQHGRIRSNTWGGKPSSRKERKQEKEKLRKMTSQGNYDLGDE
jgi:hypothetical protein